MDSSFQNIYIEIEDSAPDYMDTKPLDDRAQVAGPSADEHPFFTYDQGQSSPPPPEQRFDWMPESQPLEFPQEHLQSGSGDLQPLTAAHNQASPVPGPQMVAPVKLPAPNQPAVSAPLDPWASPLPAWETSRNEYPVLMHNEPRRSSKWKLLVAIALLTASIIAFYFVVLRQSNQERAQAVETPKPAQPESDAKNPPAVTAPAPTDKAPPQQQSNPPAQTSEPQGQGTISLQAMSSPNEKEAREFAEKLVRAGISAYVVAADLKEKGRWYRVRVGRFSTREEAARYGEQSKARARAAGLKLNLITVDERS